jgi:predicted secreted hydrolase
MHRDPVPWAVIGIVILGLLAAPWGQHAERTSRGSEQLRGVLGESNGTGSDGYARVTGPRAFEFPADHGAHPDYRSEWWYVTGNLRDGRGRAYGFQLTLFRFALAPEMPARASAWATRQAWMGHFAVTDIASGRHIASERFQRGALGLAGTTLDPFRAWLDDWSMRSIADDGEGLFPMRLAASTEDVALSLRLAATKPRLLQGEAGYSRKGNEPGNASYYYSYTRLRASGQLRLDGRWRSVTGSAWLDREWSTSALGSEQTGWDWFALQLDDGRDVMVYRLRRRDGSTDPASYGVVVGPEGSVQKMGPEGFDLQPQRRWTDPVDGARYPIVWRLRIPAHGIDARVRARVADQLMDLGFRYWEGSVRVDPAGRGTGVGGVGYLEMTGY